MKSIEISGFKAFGEPICLDFEMTEKSMVLYGENGSGKSSIYDALQMVYYRDRLLARTLTIGATPEQRTNEESDFYFAFRHRPISSNINIHIDGEAMSDYDASQCLCFMLDCHAADCPSGSINLCDMLDGMMQTVITGVEELRDFIRQNADTIVTMCNEALEHRFIESFRIGIENDAYGIYIEDSSRGLRSSVNLYRYFNEAKLHLVNLLLQLVTIRLLVALRPKNTKKMLVMDDVVTSLDSSNRSFIIHYLLSDFCDMQIILMTHNLGFNNVFYNIAKDSGRLGNWLFANLYLNAGGPHLYDYTKMHSATGIKRAFEQGVVGLDNIGTMIRRRFEALLLEVSKILCIGASEDASTLINRLLNQDKPIFICKRKGKIQLADDLVQEIKHKASQTGVPPESLLKQIINEIDRFNTEHSLGNLIPVIRQFREYEKLVIHELSHGYTAMPPFNQKEVEASLVLLEKMEDSVKSLRVKNVGM